MFLDVFVWIIRVYNCNHFKELSLPLNIAHTRARTETKRSKTSASGLRRRTQQWLRERGRHSGFKSIGTADVAQGIGMLTTTKTNKYETELTASVVKKEQKHTKG